jgi:hypothetical protein
MNRADTTRPDTTRHDMTRRCGVVFEENMAAVAAGVGVSEKEKAKTNRR